MRNFIFPPQFSGKISKKFSSGFLIQYDHGNHPVSRKKRMPPMAGTLKIPLVYHLIFLVQIQGSKIHNCKFFLQPRANLVGPRFLSLVKIILAPLLPVPSVASAKSTSFSFRIVSSKTKGKGTKGTSYLKKTPPFPQATQPKTLHDFEGQNWKNHSKHFTWYSKQPMFFMDVW